MSNYVASGTVGIIKENTGGFYATAVDGVWYGVGKGHPPFVEGDYIEFNFSENGNYKNMDVRSVVKKEASVTQAVPVKTVTKSMSKTVGMSRDDYWADKALKDIDKDRRIQLMSSRNAAINTVELLLNSNALKVPEAIGKRYDVILAAIGEITNHYESNLLDNNKTNEEIDGEFN